MSSPNSSHHILDSWRTVGLASHYGRIFLRHYGFSDKKKPTETATFCTGQSATCDLVSRFNSNSVHNQLLPGVEKIQVYSLAWHSLCCSDLLGVLISETATNSKLFPTGAHYRPFRWCPNSDHSQTSTYHYTYIHIYSQKHTCTINYKKILDTLNMHTMTCSMLVTKNSLPESKVIWKL